MLSEQRPRSLDWQPIGDQSARSSAPRTLPGSRPEAPIRDNRHSLARLLPWLIISIGILARLIDYLGNRSLWFDEESLALNILDRSFSSLFEPLDYAQAAPVLFLWMEKCAAILMGMSEYALRLVPFIAGMLSVPLFYRFANCYLPRSLALLALSLFAAYDPLIRYSSEVKQYSSDVLIGLIIYLGLNHFHRAADRKSSCLLGLIGALAVWFSFPAIFILLGAGLVMAISRDRSRQHSERALIFLPIAFWAASLIGLTFTHLLRLEPDRHLLERYGPQSFMPLGFPSTLSWFPHLVHQFIGNGPDWQSVLVIGLSVLGAASFAHKRPRDLSYLLAPGLITLISSSLHLFPCVLRFLLFLVPAGIVLIVAGVGQIKFRWSPLLQACLLVLTLLFSLLAAGDHLVRPRQREELRLVMRYIQKHWQPDDFLYVYHLTSNGFEYYRRLDRWPDIKFRIGDFSWYNEEIISSDSWEPLRQDLLKLQGRHRVWVLMTLLSSDKHKHQGKTDREVVAETLHSIGTGQEVFAAKGARAFLFDLSQTGPPPGPDRTAREEIAPSRQISSLRPATASQ